MNLIVEDYSDKSFAVFGNIVSFRNKLTELGGTENQYLKRKTTGAPTPGFVFPNFKRKTVEEFVLIANNPDPLDSVSKSSVKKDIVEKKSDESMMIHQLLSRIEKLETEVASLKRIVFKAPVQTNPTPTKQNSTPINTNDSSDEEEENEKEKPVKSHRLLRK